MRYVYSTEMSQHGEKPYRQALHSQYESCPSQTPNHVTITINPTMNVVFIAIAHLVLDAKYIFFICDHLISLVALVPARVAVLAK
jgi:hypothetical protein